MTLFLAIETATDIGSVAVGDAASVAAEIVVGGRRHATALAPAAHEALRLAGAAYGDLDGIVVADGPGSFTGLRIGFATALGILREHDRLELRTAPSMLAAAWSVSPFASGAIAVLYDALRGEVFGAVYGLKSREGRAAGQGEGQGRIEVFVEPCRATVADLRARCPVTPALAIGDGAAAYSDLVREWTGRAPVAPPAGSPRAGALLGLLGVVGGTLRVEDPATFEPAYGRLAEAQVRWEREHGRPLPHPHG